MLSDAAATADAAIDELAIDDVATYARVGELMARLHAHAETWTPPADFEVLSWDADGLLGDDATWGRFWEADLLDADGRALLTRFRAHARIVLDELGTGPEHVGLVHGDFLPENLLLGPDGSITLLDFDDCGRGWFLFDIATALFMPSIEETYPAVRDAFVAGYRRAHPLPETDVALLPLFLALRAATYVGWMQTRSHTRFAKDMGPLVAAGAVDLVATLLDGDATP
jgi:Ser/Thr protein kinase RdoA (MazF antagonist)